MAYHKHILIKAYVSNAPRVNEEELNSWLTSLVENINMKAIIPARSKYVSAEGNAGLTGSVNIETSHIAVHIWCEEQPNLIQMDVYSCRDFQIETILNKLKEWSLISYHYWLIDRNGTGFDLLEIKSS